MDREAGSMMCPCKRSDLTEGTFLADRHSGKLWEIRETPSKTHVRLMDARWPLESPRFEPMLIAQVLRFDVVEPGPNPADTASVDEWGSAG